MPQPRMIPLQHERLSDDERTRRARAAFERARTRRSVREFSDEPVPRELIEWAVRTAGTAPSGANLQPWTFVAVSDPRTKTAIREAAEREERISYEGGRMPAEWLEALAPLGTGWRKPFLETAPWIVVVFEQLHRVAPDGSPLKNYYVKESVGLACGLFVSALHEAGLVTLTHTPSPMGFLARLLGRPAHERPFILFPVGYPAAGAVVPDIARKPIEEILLWDPAP